MLSRPRFEESITAALLLHVASLKRREKANTSHKHRNYYLGAKILQRLA